MKGSLATLEEPQQERIRSQIEGVSELLQTSIVPPALVECIGSMDVAEIRSRLRYRLRVFLSLLGAIKRPDTISRDQVAQFSKRVQALNNLEKYLEREITDEGGRTLMLQQIDIFEKLIAFLEAGKDSGYIKLPTGYGKTVIFTEFIEALGLRSLIVVPTRELVDQTEDKIEQFAADLDVGKIYSDAKQHGQNVTITTYNSFVSRVRSGEIKPEDYDVLILDEMHRSLSQARMDTVNQFSHAIRLGFSATPDFSVQKNAALLLSEKICEKKTVEAIQEGQLCSVRSVFARTAVDLSNVDISTNGDYKQADLEKAVNIATRNQAAVKLYQAFFSGRRGIGYCAGVKHARELAAEFNKAGIVARAIWGDMNKQERSEILAAAQRGEITMICNADLLIEGFDDPGVSVCLNLRPTRSRVNAEQRGGRVLRVDRSDLNKMAYVVDIIDDGNENNGMITYPDVLFTDVLGSGEVLSPLRTLPPESLPGNVSISGLEITVDVAQMAELIRLRNNAFFGKGIGQFGLSDERKNELAARGWKHINDAPSLLAISRGRWATFVEELTEKNPLT